MRIPPSGPPDVPGFNAPGLKDAVAQSRTTGAPVFDVSAAADLFSKAPDANHRSMLMEFGDNPVNFLQSRFSLTDQQRKNLGQMTDKEQQALTNAAHTALRGNLALGVDCGKPAIGEQTIAQAGHFTIGKQTASPGSVAQMNGFAGTVNIHMNAFEG